MLGKIIPLLSSCMILASELNDSFRKRQVQNCISFMLSWYASNFKQTRIRKTCRETLPINDVDDLGLFSIRTKVTSSGKI